MSCLLLSVLAGARVRSESCEGGYLVEELKGVPGKKDPRSKLGGPLSSTVKRPRRRNPTDPHEPSKGKGACPHKQARVCEVPRRAERSPPINVAIHLPARAHTLLGARPRGGPGALPPFDNALAR